MSEIADVHLGQFSTGPEQKSGVVKVAGKLKRLHFVDYLGVAGDVPQFGENHERLGRIKLFS